MLEKRTNLLLEKETYDYLAYLAKERGITVGELIRKAIKREYLAKKEKILQSRQRAFKKILRMQEGMKIPEKLDYKELINYGRRH